MRAIVIGVLVGGLGMLAQAGTLAEAEGIKRDFKRQMDAWLPQAQTAVTPEAKAAASKARPDLVGAAKKMWACLKPSLAEDWVLEPASWLLRMSPSVIEMKPDGTQVMVMGDAVDEIRKAVETVHLRSPKLAPVCLGLVALPDPRSRALLEKIEAANPDKKVQGVAALGIAMLLKNVGDGTDVMRQRLKMLKKAIIESADVEVDGMSVAKLAESELYIISYLTKGRVAPDLAGVDSGGRAMRLSDFKGKVVVLMFWGSGDEEAEGILKVAADMGKKFAGKPFAVVGVNSDPRDALRKKEANMLITWKTFSDPERKLAEEYRVGARPVAYVLDGERKIRYMGDPGKFVELTAEAVLAEPPPAPAAAAP